MSKRRIGYIVVTVLLLVGLVLAYFALQETSPTSAGQPVAVTWAGGEQVVPIGWVRAAARPAWPQ